MKIVNNIIDLKSAGKYIINGRMYLSYTILTDFPRPDSGYCGRKRS